MLTATRTKNVNPTLTVAVYTTLPDF